MLQAIADSNGDQQVVEKLLEANIDKFNQTLADKLRDWATSKLAEAEAGEAKSLTKWNSQLEIKKGIGNREQGI
ncbi:MAG: hypothetical protein F6K65_15600 [Moorea sp. SIO3C2]|nr:hypothetical protein [Moorena sp. SIO3C2]